MQNGKDGVISHYNRYNGVFEEKSVSRELKEEFPRGIYWMRMLPTAYA